MYKSCYCVFVNNKFEIRCGSFLLTIEFESTVGRISSRVDIIYPYNKFESSSKNAQTAKRAQGSYLIVIFMIARRATARVRPLFAAWSAVSPFYKTVFNLSFHHQTKSTVSNTKKNTFSKEKNQKDDDQNSHSHDSCLRSSS